MAEETTQSEVNEQASEPTGQPGTSAGSSLFPHDIPTEHWDIDFGDSKQTYQGADLPIWILVGWATFIIWAIIYLFSGLSEF